jgi:hypothetical protein
VTSNTYNHILPRGGDLAASWKQFYEQYLDRSLGKPNEQGWINVDCQLPWHDDHESKAAINVDSGNYRCMKTSCLDHAKRDLKKPEGSQILTPSEFLQIRYVWDGWTSENIVNQFRLEHLTERQNGSSSGLYKHDDSGFSKSFAVLPQTEVDRLKAAQSALDPDLDIILEYCRSRGIRYETLKEAGAGYLENYLGHEYICLPYSAGRRLVGIRLRGWHGTNKRTVKNSTFTLFGADELLGETSRTAVIVEGETDTLCLRQLLGDSGYGNVPVVGVPGVGFRHEWARHFKDFTRIISVPQSDRPSQMVLLQNLRESFGSRLEIVQLPWPPDVHGGNDVSDYLRAGDNHGGLLVELLGLSVEDIEPAPFVLDGEGLIALSSVEPSWLIPNLLERGTKTLLVGEPKSYKTWIAVNLMHSLASGKAFLGHKEWMPDSGGMKTLLVEEEGAPYRLAERIIKVFGEDHVENVYVIHRKNVKLDDLDSFSRLRQTILRLRPDLLILDPYASLHLQDENTVQGTMLVQDALNTILRVLPGCSIVTLHHTPKGAEGPRGSGALWGASDVLLKCTRKDDGIIELQTRERDLPDAGEGGLEFVFHGDTGRFTPAGAISTAKRKLTDETDSGVLKTIRDFLRMKDDWIARSTIGQFTHLDDSALRAHLIRLLALGYIDERGEGRRGSPREYRSLEGGDVDE